MTGLLSSLFSLKSKKAKEASAQQGLPVIGDPSIMKKKASGMSTEKPVQDRLRWGVDRDTAERIACRNRHWAEPAGTWAKKNTFLAEASRTEPTTFYDSVTGLPLYTAPVGRSFAEFEKESRKHGWPSFRDEEVHWENVRCLPDGEAVSLAGTHLGHNLPDSKGNRYCINLCSIAGTPTKEAAAMPKRQAVAESATPSAKPQVSYKEHKELGAVRWIRDLEAGLKASNTTGRPVFLLFQEIPGCSTCTNFGANVLSDRTLVKTIEADFVPVAIFNNAPGKDEQVLRQYREQAWNNPVVRFLDSSGKDVIPRKDGVWTKQAIAQRMVATLQASGKQPSKELLHAAGSN